MTVYFELLDDDGRVCRIMTRKEFVEDAGLKNNSAIESFLRTLTLNNNSMYKGYYLCERNDNEQNEVFYMEKVDESKKHIWYVTRDGKIVRLDKRNNKQYVQKLTKESNGYYAKINGHRKSLARIMYQKFIGKEIPKGVLLKFVGEPRVENIRFVVKNNGQKRKCGVIENGKIVQTFDSIKEAAQRCYISESTAIQNVHGRRENPLVNLVAL